MGFVNRRIRVVVDFHYTVHGFQAGWGIGETSPEDNLLHTPMVIREEVIYKVFLNLRNS